MKSSPLTRASPTKRAGPPPCKHPLRPSLQSYINQYFCDSTTQSHTSEWEKSPVIRATFFINLHATMLRCKLKSVVVRITTHLKHCHATKFRCCKLKQHVAASWTGANVFQHIFSTCNNKFCCVTMFEVGGNTANNAFQLAMQQCCVASCSDLLLVLLHLYTVQLKWFCLSMILAIARYVTLCNGSCRCETSCTTNNCTVTTALRVKTELFRSSDLQATRQDGFVKIRWRF